MSAFELIDRVRIAEVWDALGGGPLRRNRGCAFWRGSESFSVSISCERNVFFDFGPHEGGGILRLVRVARNCDRRTALAWLAVFYGVSLDDRPLSIDQRREWQQKRFRAEAWAAGLTGWREALLRELRQRRDDIWERVLAAERFGRQFVNEPGRDDLWHFAFECLGEENEGECLERWIGRVEAMTPAELAALRERMMEREAIAA